MNCSKCETKLTEGALYCHNCGARVRETRTEEFSVSADSLVRKVKELVNEGNVRRIVVKDEQGKALLEIPVTVGVVGILLVPWLAAVGAVAALATRCTLVVERKD